jgi:hypothetical protein
MAKVVDEWLPAQGIDVIAMQYQVLAQVNTKYLDFDRCSIPVDRLAS